MSIPTPASLPAWPDAVATPARLALRADLLDFDADPGFAPPASAPGVRWRPDHWLLVEGGRIHGAVPGAQPPGDDWLKVDRSGSLVLPGFIDTHVHCPQLDVIASYGTELLDWLNTYTFPAETRYADAQVAAEGAMRFVDALLAHGTTSAVVFPTVHKVSADALFAESDARGMRMVTGKVLMDRHAPDGLRDDVVQAERDCIELIEKWHGHGRQSFAVTVRFAPCSTPQQLKMAGGLMRRFPGLYMHTHVAENRDEVRWVAELFPEARSYLDVYGSAGLLNERAVLAHGIWLDDTDRALLRDTGAQIAHSPSSNLFLGSGLFDWAGAEAQGVKVSVASDVGGGTSLSMLRTLADAYKVQAMQGTRLSAWKALYAATWGAARHLGLGSEIGRLEPGFMADFSVWDWAVGPVSTHRDQVARELHERVFAWLTLGDERNLQAAFVAGNRRFRRAA
ncbi:MAG: guanine deaminase [Aquabacterium sp.]|nr:MAG: guanine deaminase [Aquabacterium sp.]